MADPFSAAVLPKVLTKYASWAMVSSAVDAILPPDTPVDMRKNYIQLLAPHDLNDFQKLMDALVADLESHPDRKSLFRLELFNRSGANPILRGILSEQIKVDNDGVADPGNVQTLTNRVQPFLSSKSFFDGMDSARYRVCAIWIDNPLTGTAEIVGTGFLISPDLVMTAHHVVDLNGLIDQVAVANPAGGPPLIQERELAGSERRLAFIFDYWSPVSPFDIKATPPGVEVVMAAPHWLEWSSRKHPDDGVKQVFGPPPVNEHLDCAVIRLAKRVGASAAGRGGGRLRGWQKLNGSARVPGAGSALAILQHPSGEAQMFDKGDLTASDPAGTRLFYSTNATNGSSGSPCFDASPDVIAFHNAGFPSAAAGAGPKNNQGIFISPVISALTTSCPQLLAESQRPFKTDDGLWSLSDDPQNPEPILGRSDFKEAVFTLFNPSADKRVIVVSEDKNAAAVGKSGKSFSTRILHSIARRRPALIVEFDAKEIKDLEPEAFLRELGRRIGLTAMDGMPEKPTNERQQNRWCATQLPKWFDDLLMDRAKQAGIAVGEPAAGPVSDQQVVLRELIWISIDDIHIFPPEGGLKELIAGMIGVTGTQGVIGPGRKALRWLMIGHVPDFIREKSIEYEPDTVWQGSIGVEAWTACIGSAFISFGEDEVRCERAKESAALMFDFAASKSRWADLADPVLRLKVMANGVVEAIEMIRKQLKRSN